MKVGDYMKCEKCQANCTDDAVFCSACGNKLAKEEVMSSRNLHRCPNCDTELESEAQKFCALCGFQFQNTQVPNTDNTLQQEQECAAAPHVGEKMQDKLSAVANSPFVHALKEDFKQSQAVNIVKTEVADRLTTHKDTQANQTTANRAIGRKNNVVSICAVIALLVIIITCIVSSLHTCAECDKNFLGREYIVWGESLCEDCYKEWSF